MFPLENIVVALSCVLAATLLVISALAYKRSKNKKMLILAGVFTIFFAKGVFLTVCLFAGIDSLYWPFIIGGILDGAALIVLYISTMRV